MQRVFLLNSGETEFEDVVAADVEKKTEGLFRQYRSFKTRRLFVVMGNFVKIVLTYYLLIHFGPPFHDFRGFGVSWLILAYPSIQSCMNLYAKFSSLH